jgi:hypothetical protein
VRCLSRDCSYKGVELVIDFVEIIKVIGDGLRLLFRLPELFKVGKLVLLSSHLVHLLHLDLLDVAVLHLASHLLHALLLLLVQLCKCSVLFFSLFSLFDLLSGIIDFADSAHFQTD